MCGIIGVVNGKRVTNELLKGLDHLEYRGYDSAGVATLVEGSIVRRRSQGKLKRLRAHVASDPIDGRIGIAHTRWATHGRPSVENAHPHSTEQVAVVHNGIIENHRELRAALCELGHEFDSATDSEVIPHLISHHLAEGNCAIDATRTALGNLTGSYAVVAMFAGDQDRLIAARNGSPLVVGVGAEACYVASDALAIADSVENVMHLEDGDIAVLDSCGIEVQDITGTVVHRPFHRVEGSADCTDKGVHRHYMHKEIHEQPRVIEATINRLYRRKKKRFAMPNLPVAFADLDRISIVACGTSLYAGLVAKYWFERVAGLCVDVEIASEFRYREPPLAPGGAAVFISQSGETADTLAALQYARSQGQFIFGLVNVAESSIAHESDVVLQTRAGPEVGVASTKAFTTQLVALACLAIRAAHERGRIDAGEAARLVEELYTLPAHIETILGAEESLAEMAGKLRHARDVLYLGRGCMYPLALEGALKLKEVSYIHAEGYPAGEMKHGPIALIDEDVPVVVLAPRDRLFEKAASNLHEVATRGGQVFLLSSQDGIDALQELSAQSFVVPDVSEFLAPIVYSVPIQLLAYHTAILKGTDVDQPRNLAKSVTVE